MTMTAIASIISASPIATWFPSRNAGNGQPHMECPMEIYISASRKPSEANSRLFSTGVSRSARVSSSAEGALLSAPFGLAP